MGWWVGLVGGRGGGCWSALALFAVGLPDLSPSQPSSAHAHPHPHPPHHPHTGFLDGIKGKTQAILKVTNAAYTYPGAAKPQLNDVNVRVSLGSRVAVLGKNGAGKSTLIKMMTGGWGGGWVTTDGGVGGGVRGGRFGVCALQALLKRAHAGPQPASLARPPSTHAPAPPPPHAPPPASHPLHPGETEADKGTVWRHPNLRLAYVAQHAFHHVEQHLDLPPEKYIWWRFESGEACVLGGGFRCHVCVRLGGGGG